MRFHGLMQRLPMTHPVDDQIDTFIWGIRAPLRAQFLQLDFSNASLEDVLDQALLCEDASWMHEPVTAPATMVVVTPPAPPSQQLQQPPPPPLVAVFCTRCYQPGHTILECPLRCLLCNSVAHVMANCEYNLLSQAHRPPAAHPAPHGEPQDFRYQRQYPDSRP